MYNQKSDVDSTLITHRDTEFGDLIGSQGVINRESFNVRVLIVQSTLSLAYNDSVCLFSRMWQLVMNFGIFILSVILNLENLIFLIF